MSECDIIRTELADVNDKISYWSGQLGAILNAISNVQSQIIEYLQRNEQPPQELLDELTALYEAQDYIQAQLESLSIEKASLEKMLQKCDE